MPKQSWVVSVLFVAVFSAYGCAHAPRAAVVSPAAPLQLSEDACVNHLSTSITFPTIGATDQAQLHGQSFRDLQVFLRATFPRVHATLACEVINDYSLLYRWQGADPARTPFILMAHQDVVPVNPGTDKDWTHPAFSGAIADGYIWGRGTLDDKSSLMSILEAVEALLAEGFQPQGTLYLAFGHDEEVGGHNGAVKIVAHLKGQGVKAAYVIDEGGSVFPKGIAGLTNPVALIGTAEKGYLSLQLSVEDPGGHSAMPPRNTGAGILARAITRLEANPFPAHLTTIQQTLAYLGDKMPAAKRVVVTNTWLFAPVVKMLMSGSPETDASIRTTTAVTMLSGSAKENVLPQKATAVVNFRIYPGDTIESVTARVRATIDDPRVKIQPIPNGNDPSPVSDIHARGYQLITQTIHQTLGQPELVVAPYLVLGASDARHYTPVAEQVYRFMPLALADEDLKRVHGTNERIAVPDYIRMIRFYAQLIRNAQ